MRSRTSGRWGPSGPAWRRIGIAVYLGINLGLIAYQPWNVGFIRDWDLWRAIALGGDLYRETGAELAYVWSPLMAPVVAGVVAFPAAWFIAHIAAVLLVRDWVFIGLMFCSWGFWADVAGGNTFTFAVVSGILAWRGNRHAALVYLALSFLMPRPVQLPLAFLLLWRMPEIRLPSLVIFSAHALVVSPYAVDWITRMVEYARTTPADLSPRFFIGAIWIPIAAAIAIWFTIRQKPGLAGLFASAYWLPQYFLMPLADLRSQRKPEDADRASPFARTAQIQVDRSDR